MVERSELEQVYGNNTWCFKYVKTTDLNHIMISNRCRYQIKNKKYHIGGIVPKFNRKIVDTGGNRSISHRYAWQITLPAWYGTSI